MVLRPRLCFYCRWNININSCKAYKEIPEEVFYQYVDHRNHYEGDNGIIFEPKKICYLCKHKSGVRCLANHGPIEDDWEDKDCPSFELDEGKMKELVGEKKPLPDPEEIKIFKESLKYIHF